MSAPGPKAALRLAAAVLLFAAVTAIAISVVNRRLARRQPTNPTELTIAPAAASDGVAFIAGPGRLLIVDSRPESARVVVGGVAVGATPWSADWTCEVGAPVEVRIERAGFRPFAASATCQDGTTRVSATLERGR